MNEIRAKRKFRFPWKPKLFSLQSWLCVEMWELKDWVLATLFLAHHFFSSLGFILSASIFIEALFLHREVERAQPHFSFCHSFWSNTEIIYSIDQAKALIFVLISKWQRCCLAEFSSLELNWPRAIFFRCRKMICRTRIRQCHPSTRQQHRFLLFYCQVAAKRHTEPKTRMKNRKESKSGIDHFICCCCCWYLPYASVFIK